MSETLRPRLVVRAYNGAQRALEALGRRPQRFAASEPALLEAARQATGLNDFGDAAFLDHLRVLLRAYDEEARLTPFGRMMVQQELAGTLRARLTVEDAWKREPAVLTARIRRPIFILGLPRSGTTALHHLLAQDPANQVLEYWLAQAPGPRPPQAAWDSDPRYQQALRGLRFMYYLDPSLKAIHLMTADGPEECRHLFLQSFLDHTFDHNATIPSYTKWFEAQDMRKAYARHRDVLKLIGAPTPERRWVLKYPAHMLRLEILLETYPDACIVQTHRDPARVLPSICSLVTGWRGLYEGRVDGSAIARWQVEFLSNMLEHAAAARRAHDPARFYDLHFHDVVADPVQALRGVYAHFGFDWSEEGERGMRAWRSEHPQGGHGGHHYTSEQYGLDPAQVADRFKPYTERFGVRAETRV